MRGRRRVFPLYGDTHAVGFYQPYVLHPCGRAGFSEQGHVARGPFDQLGAANLFERLGCGLCHLVAVWERLGSNPVGDAYQRGKGAPDYLVALIYDPLHQHRPGFRFQVQPADRSHVGHSHKLGDTGSHLPGFSVGAVTAAQNQIGLFPLQHHAQRAGRGQRVRPGQGAVGQKNGPVAAQRQAFQQAVSSLGRAHAHHDHLIIGRLFQLGGAHDAQHVESVYLGRDSLSNDFLILIVELNSGHDRDVFDTDSELHWQAGPLNLSNVGLSQGSQTLHPEGIRNAQAVRTLRRDNIGG